MRKIALSVCLLTIVITLAAGAAYAQETGTLTLRLRRDFGYGAGNDIQGNFSTKVNGPENLVRVEYYLDDRLMGQSSEPADFRFKFDTDDYPPGVHTLSAVGFTSGGDELGSNTITRNFLTASESRSSTFKVVGIILGLVVVVSLVSFGISMLAGGRKKGSTPMSTPRSYGPLGGTVCPKCGRSFSRHFWGLNIGIGKFDRCPHCGKWSVTMRASPGELMAAEEAELEAAQEVPEDAPVISEEERLRKDLYDSRFEDV